MTQALHTIFDVLETRVKQRDPGARVFGIPPVGENRIFGALIISGNGDEEFYVGYPLHDHWELESTKEKR